MPHQLLVDMSCHGYSFEGDPSFNQSVSVHACGGVSSWFSLPDATPHSI